jgi:hypothetical protein
MPRHRDPLVSFDVPRDWDNRTIIVFRAPVEGDERAPNLVMTRDRMADDDEDLYVYADRQVADLAKQLKGFVILGSKEEAIDGHPAITVSFTSASKDGQLVQRLTMVQLPDRRVASFTLTSPEVEMNRVAPLFQRILESVKFEQEEA